MSIERDETLEISQVGNGYIVRRAANNWFDSDKDRWMWTGSRDDYLVFRTMAELSEFLAQHFTWRAVVGYQDKVRTVPDTPMALTSDKPERKKTA